MTKLNVTARECHRLSISSLSRHEAVVSFEIRRIRSKHLDSTRDMLFEKCRGSLPSSHTLSKILVTDSSPPKRGDCCLLLKEKREKN